MKIDCDTCAVKDIACGDCVVNLFLSLPAQEMDVNEREDLTLSETRALDVMARSGLIPRLQLVKNPQRNAG
ncbi:MAG: hypothetical protein RIS43_1021 [Actinomycetota bacterium]